MTKRNLLIPLAVLVPTLLLIASGSPVSAQTIPNHGDNLERDKLVAWCIVPFDKLKRGPAERAEMIQRLGLKRIAYDWRQEHVASFEQEILEYKKRGLEYFAFWGTHPKAFELFKKHELHPQIWNIFPAGKGKTHAEQVANAAAQLLPLVEQTRKAGCKLGLYNHGGWSGEPKNMVAVCRYLRKHHAADHVGLVYNLHHAHEHIDDFANVVSLIKPFLLCLNLNGMDRNGEQHGRKIIPLGEGEFDVSLLQTIRDAGYGGPIGIIGHTQDDVEQRLTDNLNGLDWIKPQLDGKPAGDKPKLLTWSVRKSSADRFKSVVLPGQPNFRLPPITVECRVTLSSKDAYNILVASDTKASGTHWELFTVAGSGLLSAYTPGLKPDHIHSNVMLCDGKPHTIAMLYDTDRIQLRIDGKDVANQTVESLGREPMPGGLAIGRLVGGALGCHGQIDWVRISRGIRSADTLATSTVKKDKATALLWQNATNHKAASITESADSLPEYSTKTITSVLKDAEHGDVARGLVQFASAKSACVSCHRIGKHGGKVGPDLTDIGKQRKPEEIVEAVLWPKRHVKPEYSAWMFVTEDGKSRRGYVIQRDDKQIVLRDPTKPDAPNVTINVDEIEFQSEVGTLMPDNLVAAMTPTNRNDLFRFLLSLGRDQVISATDRDALLAHATSHSHGPASFPIDRKPLRPEQHPHWQHHVNRDRIYDFYSKQADYFKQQPTVPELLTQFPGLDGGNQGHWGNQNETVWANNDWNSTDLGPLQAGVFRGPGFTINRAVCVRLGSELSVCFNPETLTYEAVWKDGFLKMSSVRHGFVGGLTLDGTPLPKPNRTKPNQPFDYHGFYRHGDRIIFAYRIGDTEYLDSPSVKDGQFVRTVVPATDASLKKLTSNAPTAWPEKMTTAIDHGDASPYAIDTIHLPTDNPWKSLTYVGGLNFLTDGSALICTMQGDVWRASDIQYPSKTATWKRFATGLHQPLGMVIDKDGIFVLCRDQITRLQDLNDDGEADFYECFSNAHVTSKGGHDYICGLERDSDGNFFTSSGNQGVVRISADGQKADVIATGFRNPDGIGLLPDGTVTVPCSEGTWTPATMICAVRPSPNPSYHGFGGPKNGQPPTLPLVYLPRAIDNSAGGQTIVNSDRWGPLQNQLLHFSFGTGSYHLVLRDEVDGQLQGAVVSMPGEFLSGSHRGRFNPQDGQLYVGGMQGWGSYTPETGCLQRVRYVGQDVQMPIEWRAHENGVAIRFSQPINAEFATNVKNQFAQCWNYRYSKAYGSPEYSSTRPGVKGHDALTIASAHVIDDGFVLFLQIPEIQPVNTLHLRIMTDQQTHHDLFATVHKLRSALDRIPNVSPGYISRKKTINRHPIHRDLALASRNIWNPHSKTKRGARQIEIKTSGNLSFDTRRLTAKPGELIAIKLVNADVVPHNWALVKPGTLERVGRSANKLISDPDAVLRQYVPDSTDVLAYTDIVLPNDRFTIYFKAPKQKGKYPYLCTFPGHWLVMNGELLIE